MTYLQIANSFFCLLSLLLKPSRDFFNLVVFFSSRISVWLFFIISLCWWSHFVHISFSWLPLILVFSFYLYTYKICFKLFVEYVWSLCFFRVSFWTLILSYQIDCVSLFLCMPLWSSVESGYLKKHPPHPLFGDCSVQGKTSLKSLVWRFKIFSGLFWA